MRPQWSPEGQSQNATGERASTLNTRKVMGSARDSDHRVGEIKVSLCHLPSGLKAQSSEMTTTTTTVEPIRLATHGETRVRRLSEIESRVSDLLRSVQSLENYLPTYVG